MDINSPDFARRRVLRASNEYSPKRRWDQNAFGSERRMLINHVENTLKDHENDGDILEKFRKEADELKQRKRRERFPYLFKNETQSSTPSLQTKKHINQFLQQPIPSQPQPQQFKQKQSFVRPFQSPHLQNYPPFAIPSLNPFQLEARIQYQRAMAQKDLELYKKQQKIKRQKKEISRLYRQMKERERDDELQKYVKSHEEIKKMNQMLVDMREELTSRKPNFSDKRDLLVDAHLQAEKRRNRSEVYLNSYNSMEMVKDHVRDRKQVRDMVLAGNQSPVSRKSVFSSMKEPVPGIKNPQISYSPEIKNNRSSVFQKVPMYNSPLLKSSSLNSHLEQLKNYNVRLEYLQGQNRAKLSQIA